MLPVAVLCDFDGTVVPEDVSEELLETHGDPSWYEIDLKFQRGEIGSRECALRQVALLPSDPSLLLDDATSRFKVDPDFPPFVHWCQSLGIEIAVVSDGFGFYIQTMLEIAGLPRLPILSNVTSFAEDIPTLSFPNANSVCIGCGTCKMNAVVGARTAREGPVAFVGEGHTDRFAAFYADLVFASKDLADICESAGIPYVPWDTFSDVHDFLANEHEWPARKPSPPLVCPGWTEPS